MLIERNEGEGTHWYISFPNLFDTLCSFRYTGINSLCGSLMKRALDEDVPMQAEEADKEKVLTKKRSNNSSSASGANTLVPVFLSKAHNIISSCPLHIGGWTEGGQTFVIKDTNSFAQQVIPLAFKHNNWSSFTRQLNIYGFRRVKSDVMQTVYEYKHPMFIRGQPELLEHIKRTEAHNRLIDPYAEAKEDIVLLTSKLEYVDGLLDNLKNLVVDLLRQRGITKEDIAELKRLQRAPEQSTVSSSNSLPLESLPPLPSPPHVAARCRDGTPPAIALAPMALSAFIRVHVNHSASGMMAL